MHETTNSSLTEEQEKTLVNNDVDITTDKYEKEKGKSKEIQNATQSPTKEQIYNIAPTRSNISNKEDLTSSDKDFGEIISKSKDNNKNNSLNVEVTNDHNKVIIRDKPIIRCNPFRKAD
eukprot:7343302-Ditylum_brightwellii.AAC.1